MPQLFRVVDPRGQLPWQVREAFIGKVFPLVPPENAEVFIGIVCHLPDEVSPYRVRVDAALQMLGFASEAARSLQQLAKAEEHTSWIEFDDDEVELVVEPMPLFIGHDEQSHVASA